MKYYSQFGMTPSSRIGIKIIEPQVKKEPSVYEIIDGMGIDDE